MSEPFIGQIQPFGFNFAPRGWTKCDGQLLPIAQHTALFSLLGTTYGGDGRTTFGLPDLRGRAALHQGTGAGLTNRRIGEKAGSQTETLTVSQMPSHNHVVQANTANADTIAPNSASLATAREDTYNSSSPNTSMHANAIANTGGGQSHNIMQPYLVVNWCIALTGVFPSRN